MPLGLRPCGLKIKPVVNGSHCFKLAREIQQAKYNLKEKMWVPHVNVTMGACTRLIGYLRNLKR